MGERRERGKKKHVVFHKKLPMVNDGFRTWKTGGSISGRGRELMGENTCPSSMKPMNLLA